MKARIFIIFVAPPIIVFAFFFSLVRGGLAFRPAFIAVGKEVASIKRDWKAGYLTPEKDVD
ncbi:hypothetical protein IB276_10960 [Ensifer sp. ENS04]|uniref:hypothetical protein n=1 Tax=Ensifer sp. ENS04 TaxID=2769281 RepID=UPI00177EEA61|nr:hypothetical protein [Ensifer sp. ENS04]MBD9539971.1 hypothetical protein [Ensifer sp. ENS04]